MTFLLWTYPSSGTRLDLYKEVGGKRNKKVLGLAWVSLLEPYLRIELILPS